MPSAILRARPGLRTRPATKGVMVAELIAGGHPHPIKPNSIAGCTYCHPQVASVGLTEAESERRGLRGQGRPLPLHRQRQGDRAWRDRRDGQDRLRRKNRRTSGRAHDRCAEVTELIQGYVVGRTLETTEGRADGGGFPASDAQSEMMHESVLDAYGRALAYLKSSAGGFCAPGPPRSILAKMKGQGERRGAFTLGGHRRSRLYRIALAC